MRWNLVVCVLLGGCSLVSKSEPLQFRYFSPEATTQPAAPAHEEPIARLRLGRVTQSANLQYRIVHRDSAVELASYETLRWTERPDAYVRRALSRALFEERPLEQAVDTRAPRLEIEVLAFEEVRRPARDSGRVQLRYTLSDDRAVLDSGVVTVERAAAGRRIEYVVAAIRAALEAATQEVAERVVATLRQDPALEATAKPDARNRGGRRPDDER